MATDRLINSTQGDSIITALNDISAKIQQVNQVDTALSTTSTNPVQNKVITSQLSKDRAALVELIDSGAKNHAKINDFTATLWQQVEIEPIGGTIHLHIGGYSSTDTDSTTFLANFKYADGTTSGKLLTKGAVDMDFNLGNYTLTRIDIYASDNWNHSSGDTIAVSDLMVCSKTAWDISQKYVPASPSNAELYELIKALQSGSSSLSSVQSTAQLTALDKTTELTTIDDNGYTTENS